MAKEQPIRMIKIRMLGNVREYENGKEYAVLTEEANQITGLGMAVVVQSTEEE